MLPPIGRGGLVGAGVASPEAVKETRLSIESEIGISEAMSGSGGAENKSEKPPPVLGTSDIGCGSASFDLLERRQVEFSSLHWGVGFGGSGLDGGGPGLGGADGRPGGAEGLPGGAGLGGGGLAGATSRFRDISSSSLKLS
jgi:hypothetical protein